MRGQVSDQDLTDYALNELAPAERLYVESMLAVSDECRNDVYEMIDVAMLLDQGFERAESKAADALRPEQREALLAVRTAPRQYVPPVAALLAAAAAVAFTVTHPGIWQWKTGGAKVAQVSKQVSDAVEMGDGADAGSLLANWRQLADDPVLMKWFSSEWFDHSSQTASVSPGWESMGRAGFEMIP